MHLCELPDARRHVIIFQSSEIFGMLDQEEAMYCVQGVGDCNRELDERVTDATMMEVGTFEPRETPRVGAVSQRRRPVGSEAQSRPCGAHRSKECACKFSGAYPMQDGCLDLWACSIM